MVCRLTWATCLFILLLCPPPGRATVYFWTDETGIRHFSNIAPPVKRPSQVTEEQGISLPKGFSCRVVKVYDGDTIRVRGQGLAFKVRLAGIDSPESAWKTRPAQPFAREASEALIKRILFKTVVLKQYGTGSYNRILAEVFLGAENINLSMVRSGWAEVYQGDISPALDIHAFRQAEKWARQRESGIWSQGETYISPKSWRKKYRLP